MENSYFLRNVGFHFILALVGWLFKPILYVYPFVILLYGSYFIFKYKNRNNETLIACAYVVGIEVFIRMTETYLLYESGKYLVIWFVLLGIYFRGFSSKSLVYVLLLILLVPSILVAVNNYNFDLNVRKSIIFSLLGPVTLFISAFYCLNRTVFLDEMEKIIQAFALPLLSVLFYVFLYTPSNVILFQNTDSNHDTSGGFGPNQVATALGLGGYAFFVLFLFFSKNFFQKTIFSIFSSFFLYRALITFSRGGLITAVLMIVAILLCTYFVGNYKIKFKIKMVAVFALVFGFFVFSLSVYQTNELLLKRYTGKDAIGRKKASMTSGREDIAAAELKLFYDNPIFGVGVGRNEVEKEAILGISISTHNEITRMLAEHGFIGIFIFLVLFFNPLLIFFSNKINIFCIPFFIFWFMTINHAALRIAAPCFVYALTLINFKMEKKSSLIQYGE